MILSLRLLLLLEVVVLDHTMWLSQMMQEEVQVAAVLVLHI
jgi:hypothetical protein